MSTFLSIFLWPHHTGRLRKGEGEGEGGGKDQVDRKYCRGSADSTLEGEKGGEYM